jgi:hypothetical protein
MYKEKIVDALTGEETWRDYTEAEIAEVEAAQALAEKKQLEAEEKEAARKVLLTKLGISNDEAKLLLS